MTGLRPPSIPNGDLFSGRVREYAHERPTQPIRILEAGCGIGDGLDLDRVRCHVTGVDLDTPTLLAHTRNRRDLDVWTLGDLRTVPMPPRMYDVVHASFLIERIPHAELVLDRFVAALKPGGLLLVRLRDRASAYGFIDRMLPDWLRTVAWQGLHRHHTAKCAECDEAHQVEPPPAVYEPVASYRGMRWYCVIRGLVIAEEMTSRSRMTTFGRWNALVGGVCRAVASLSRGRLTAAHSEVTLVIRKPEGRCARVIRRFGDRG